MTDIGIVCPECGGNLSSNYKRRRGNAIRRRYICENSECQSQKDGYEVSVHTIERCWYVHRKPIKSTSRTKRSKIPSIDQIEMAIPVGESKIEAARK
jgi:hypothetical protein